MSNNPLLLIINVPFCLSGFGVFWLVKWIRARQGIGINLAFAEIPPECALLLLVRTQARMIAHISEVFPLLAFRRRGRIPLVADAHISVRVEFLGQYADLC
jgi:hypothetical protein